MPSGKGIFQEDKFTPTSLLDRHLKFPNIRDDKGLSNVTNKVSHFCAYKSIEQVQQWIMKDEIEHLVSKGCNILMLDVSECHEGEFQILFKKENIIQSKIINDLFL